MTGTKGPQRISSLSLFAVGTLGQKGDLGDSFKVTQASDSPESSPLGLAVSPVGMLSLRTSQMVVATW